MRSDNVTGFKGETHNRKAWSAWSVEEMAIVSKFVCDTPMQDKSRGATKLYGMLKAAIDGF